LDVNANIIDDLDRCLTCLAYYARGIAKIKSGDKNGGCLDLSKAGELGFDAYDTIKKYCN